MGNNFKTQVTLFSNKFEVTVYTDLINSVKHLNIGNLVKKKVTEEIQRLIGKGVNVSSFKRYQDLINTKLEETNFYREEFIGTKSKTKSPQLFLTIQYVGTQEKRDKKIEQIFK